MLYNLLLSDTLGVDLDSFAESVDVGRCEEPRSIATELEGRGCLDRDRAFAIRASDVDGRERVLRIAELLSE